MKNIEDKKFLKGIEQKIIEDLYKECLWCGKKYDFKERQKQVRKQDLERKITTTSHASDYCENQCWFEADKTGSC